MTKPTGRAKVIAGGVAFLALLLALVRPQHLSGAPSGKSDEKKQASGGGLSFSFGASGVAVDVQEASRGRIAEVVHAPASIKSGGEIAVGAPFEGKIVELCHDEGDPVKKDEVIFRLDPIEWDDKLQESKLELARRRSAVAESEAELREAEHKSEEARKEASAVTEARLKVRISELQVEKAHAQLDNAEAKLARARDMLAQNVGKKDDVDAAEAEKRVESIALDTSERELIIAKEFLAARSRAEKDDRVSAEKALDTARMRLEKARSDVTAGQVAVERARRERERCDVRSPIEGVVTQRNVNWGSLVGRGDGRTADSTHYIVSDMAHMYAYADIDEGDITKVKPEQSARIRVNALGDIVRLQGKVVDVANRAQKVSNEETKSFRVRILISPRDDRLRPDMSANVDVETRASPDDALRIPSQAIVQRAKKDVPEAALAKAVWLGKDAGAASGTAAPGTATATAAPASGGGSALRAGDNVDCVFVIEGDKAVLRPVQIGVSDGDFVEAKAGLEGPEQIVIGPYRTLEGLKQGDSVRATKKERTADVAATSSQTSAKPAVSVEVKGR